MNKQFVKDYSGASIKELTQAINADILDYNNSELENKPFIIQITLTSYANNDLHVDKAVYTAIVLWGVKTEEEYDE